MALENDNQTVLAEGGEAGRKANFFAKNWSLTKATRVPAVKADLSIFGLLPTMYLGPLEVLTITVETYRADHPRHQRRRFESP